MKKHVAFLLAAATAIVIAQNYAIPSFTIDGGGGSSTGGNYSVTGTIGQHDASPMASTAGPYALTGGFWAEFQISQTGGAPLLALRGSGGTLRVFWAANVPGWILQTSSSMAAGSWDDVSGAPIVDGPEQYHLFTTVEPRHYFRLRLK